MANNKMNPWAQTGMGIAAGAANGAIGQGMGLIFGRMQDERQLKQQQKLTDMQMAANKEMSDYQQRQAMAMWRATNYGPQIEEAKKAGMSISALYGGSGAGGATTGGASAAGVSGGQAGDPNAGVGMGIQMASQIAMQKAQTENIQADTELKKEQAAKTGGIDTEKAGEETKATRFQNQVNENITAKKIAENYQWAADKVEIESQRANAEWEAFQAAGFKGKTFDDPNSPLAKAMSAGYEKSVEELKQAKTENNIKRAEQVIEEYKANLAKVGIAPETPWGIKLIGDLLDKIGVLNLIKR